MMVPGAVCEPGFRHLGRLSYWTYIGCMPGDKELQDAGTIDEKEGNPKMGAGIAIGAAMGVALDNIVVGMGVGVAIGVGIGAAMSRK